MSIDGIGGIVPGALPTTREIAHEAEQQAGPQFELDGHTPEQPDTTLAGVLQDRPSVPERAPTGTDPEAWALLTPDEREFFRDPSLLGPITYGRDAIDAAMTTLGSTLDVRG